MKKNIFLALAIIGITATGYSQKIKFGAKAGMNMASWAGDEEDGTNMRVSVHFGGLVEFKLTDKFSIQPEVLYSGQGATTKGLYTYNQSYKAAFRFDYLNVPVMAKYYIVEGFNVEAGPQVGVLLSSKVMVKVDDTKTVDDFEGKTNDVDISANIGLGYDLPMGIFFNARYSLGLNKVNDTKNETVNNRVFSLSVGYKF
jgi:hypothetical protein